MLSLHLAQILCTLSVLILPIFNIYYLAKFTKILKTFKEGS